MCAAEIYCKALVSPRKTKLELKLYLVRAKNEFSTNLWFKQQRVGTTSADWILIRESNTRLPGLNNMDKEESIITLNELRVKILNCHCEAID